MSHTSFMLHSLQKITSTTNTGSPIFDRKSRHPLYRQVTMRGNCKFHPNQGFLSEFLWLWSPRSSIGIYSDPFTDEYYCRYSSGHIRLVLKAGLSV